jgi:hypothetical protein
VFIQKKQRILAPNANERREISAAEDSLITHLAMLTVLRMSANWKHYSYQGGGKEK